MCLYIYIVYIHIYIYNYTWNMFRTNCQKSSVHATEKAALSAQPPKSSFSRAAGTVTLRSSATTGQGPGANFRYRVQRRAHLEDDRQPC